MAIVRNNNLAKSAKFFDSEGALNVIEGSNVTITTDNTAGTITIASTASSNIDSASVEAIVDSSYIQARQITYSTADFLDSARAEAIIDSSYVQTRQDYAYSSLTGAPTNVSSFTNDAGYTTYDSTNAAGQIEAYAYSTYDSTNAAGQIEAYGYTTYDSTNFSQQLSAASGTSFDPVGTDNSTDVTLAGSYDYITISGQEITRNQVDATTDISNLTTSNVTEGTNLYYTTERADSDARAAINVNSTAPGALSYSQATGTLYYTGPNDTEIRGSFSGGTGVTITFGEIAIGQDVGTTDSVTFGSVTTTGNVIVGGNLQVTGTTTTVNSEDLNVTDNMIYMNAGESSGSPTASIDVGWAANVNDQGSYYHVGLFRDATDQTFKVFHEYTPEPDASVEINTGHASFALAPFAASTLTGVYQGFDSDVTAAGLATQIYVTSTIDSSYVQARQTPQDFAYSSLTGAPTNVSTFTNDANYISTGDSASLSELIVTGNLTGNSLRADNLTTQNAFVIVGDSNNLIQDTTLSVDPASNYLGINQTSPEVTLHMTGEGAQTAQIRMEQYNNSADAPDLRTRRYRGTIASPSSIQPGDYLYRSNHEYWNGSALIVGGTFAFDNTNDSNRTQFAISVTTDGTSADANTPSKIQFKIDGNDGGAITFNNAYKFPTSDGTNDQVLATDGGGNLSFVSVASISGGVDSGDVKSIVDSAYINARVVIPTAFDSADVVGIVDSAYVQARQTPQDFAYSSLTGAPTNVSSFTNDAGYTTYDSTNAAGQIEAYGYTTYDSTNAAGQIEAYGYTTFDSTNAVGLITGYGYSTYDSTNASGQIEAYGYTTYDSSNTTGMLSSYASQSYVTGAIDDRVDQTFVENLGISYTSLTNKPTNLYDSTNFNSQLTPAIGASIQAYDSNLTDFVNAFTLPVSDGSSNNVLSTNGSGTLSFVSVASISGSVDSGDVRSIVDSDYVQARQIPPNNVDLTNYHYVATAGQTSFSGSDIAGNSLTYTTSNIQVFKNGVLLIDSDDYTATNGSTIVLSSSARSGDTISISNYGQSAGSLNLRDSGSGITVTASLSVEGAMYVNGSVETLIDKSSATGTVTHDFSEGALFYHSSISSNFTVNLTNFPTTNGKAIVVSLILDQGATAYIPNALQVGGVAQTINWFGGSAPSGNANKKDLVAFTLIRRSSSWTVLGQLSSYG